MACQLGAQKATGEVLVFIDSDVRIGARTLLDVAKEYQKNKSPFSIQPYHIVNKFYEHFTLFFNLVAVAGNGVACPFSQNKAGMFGHFIVIGKKDFENVCGYNSIKASIIEDVMLGRILKKNGINYNLFVGESNVSFKMYNNFFAIFEGYTKNYISGAIKTPFLILILTFAWITSLNAFPIIIIQNLVIAANYITGILAAFMYLLIVIQLSNISKKVGSLKKKIHCGISCFLYTKYK